MVMTARLLGGDVDLINYSRTTSITDQRHFVYITGTTGHLSFVPSRNEPVIETEGQRKRVDLPEAKKDLPGPLRELPACVREDLEPAMPGEAQRPGSRSGRLSVRGRRPGDFGQSILRDTCRQ